uniref:Uncharacterized protein n=1 Tax=Glossina palpalis gambiensis TaxID=67801 RepID=A0A1B0B5N1_9MUSC
YFIYYFSKNTDQTNLDSVPSFTWWHCRPNRDLFQSSVQPFVTFIGPNFLQLFDMELLLLQPKQIHFEYELLSPRGVNSRGLEILQQVTSVLLPNRGDF